MSAIHYKNRPFIFCEVFMYRYSLILPLFLYASLAFSQAVSHACARLYNADIVGTAKSIDNKNIIYCESHYLSGDIYRVDNVPTAITNYQRQYDKVKYHDLTQQLIVQKSVDYSFFPLAPDIEQNDFRNQQLIKMTAQTADKTLLLEYRRASTKEGERTIKSKRLPLSSLVADAGFNNAIRSRWNDIQTNGSTVFSFAVPTRLRAIKLAVKSAALSQCYQKMNLNLSYIDEKHICYVVQPNSTLLTMFVKPLFLIYERDMRQLMAFYGAANVADKDGKVQQVLLEYQYY